MHNSSVGWLVRSVVWLQVPQLPKIKGNNKNVLPYGKTRAEFNPIDTSSGAIVIDKDKCIK